MTAASAEATERVEQLILLTERLTDLVASSAQAFEARRPQDAAAYVGETGRLANLYRHESTRIRGNPGLIAGAAPARRTHLVRATEAFDAVLARQARAVGRRQDRHRRPGPRHRRGSRHPAAEGRQLRRRRDHRGHARRHRHHPQQTGLASIQTLV